MNSEEDWNNWFQTVSIYYPDSGKSSQVSGTPKARRNPVWTCPYVCTTFFIYAQDFQLTT